MLVKKSLIYRDIKFFLKVACTGGGDGRITVEACLGKTLSRPYLKNKLGPD
jgi:hypothetical protein